MTSTPTDAQIGETRERLLANPTVAAPATSNGSRSLVEPNDYEAEDHKAAWPDLDDIDDPPVPPFPLEALPPDGRAVVASLAEAMQTPLDLAATTYLGVVSAAILGLVQVEVRSGWREDPALYIAPILASGEGKSPTLRVLAEPLARWENATQEGERARVAFHANQVKTAEKRLDRAITESAKANGPDRVIAEELVRTLTDELESLGPTVSTQLLVDDVTPERLTGLLVRHHHLACFASEGGLIGTFLGRYNNGTANLDVLLKAYDGERIKVDRVGRPPEVAEHPLLTLVLCVQPNVIEEALKSRAMVERGGVGRFTFVMPKSMLGHRSLEPDPVPQAVLEEYEGRITSLLSLRERTAPAVVRFSPEGLARFNVFRAEFEQRLDPRTGDLGEITSWSGKLPGRVVRLAGILHMAALGPAGIRQSIDAETVDAAVRIGEYLVPHAQAALALGNLGPRVERARSIVRWILRRRQDAFTSRDAWQGLKGGRLFASADDVESGLRELIERGYLHPRPAQTAGAKGGRTPSRIYDVNPAAQARES